MTDKMGRNPFAAKAASEKPQTKKTKTTTRSSNADASGRKETLSKSAKNGPLRSLKDWKLERLSFLRIEGDTGAKPRVTFVDLRLKNAHWSGPHSLEVPAPFFPARWLIMRLISARISAV